MTQRFYPGEEGEKERGSSYRAQSEKAMAPHSSTLAWKIPWTEEPGRLQSIYVANSRTRLSDFTFTFHFNSLEKEMAAHSSVLAWRIPGTGEPGGLPSMGSHRVGHDWSDLAAAAAESSGLPMWKNNLLDIINKHGSKRKPIIQVWIGLRWRDGGFPGSSPGSGRSRRAEQPTPVFLPRET